MKREIKFRGNAIEEYETSIDYVGIGSLVYGYYAFVYEDHVIVTRLESESGRLGSGLCDCFVIVDPSTVCQYTGYKDTNDKEIYENDKVAIDAYYYGDYLQKEATGIVEFGDGGWFVTHDNEDEWTDLQEAVDNYGCEVKTNG